MMMPVKSGFRPLSGIPVSNMIWKPNGPVNTCFRPLLGIPVSNRVLSAYDDACKIRFPSPIGDSGF